MTNAEDMKESYQATTFKLAGSGARNVGVLKEALQNVDGQLASDMYGSGEVIEKFEQKMARILGKEAAVFFSKWYNGAANCLTYLVRSTQQSASRISSACAP